MSNAAMRVALGMKARTGRAVLVAVAGDANEPRFVERLQIPLLPEGAFAPYHAAAELDPADARASVKRSIAAAHALATSGIGTASRRLIDAGFELCGCAVLVGSLPTLLPGPDSPGGRAQGTGTRVATHSTWCVMGNRS